MILSGLDLDVTALFMHFSCRYIFIPDTSSNSLVAVNDDSFALSTLNLNEGFGSSGIVWPRSIAARRVRALLHISV